MYRHCYGHVVAGVCAAMQNRRNQTMVEKELATLLRTEVIGFNDFLHRVGVPNVEARWPCGWEWQTPKHVVMSCPGLAGRDRMLSAAGHHGLHHAPEHREGTTSGHIMAPTAGYSGPIQCGKEMAEEDRSG